MSYRIYISEKIISNISIPLSKEQSHYLTNVLRLKDSNIVRIFNDKDGEYEASLSQISKREYSLLVQKKLRSPFIQQKLSIAISLIKNDRFFLALEKACELGITDIYPIICNRSQYSKLNLERAQKCLIEASEQSERFDIPKIYSPQILKSFIKSYDNNKLIICSEKAKAENSLLNLENKKDKDLCFLIGPEGGFDNSEFESMSDLKHISLCNNILRAETAVISLISQIQLLRLNH